MAFLSSLNIGGSALTAQRFRMDVISQNIANAETTKTENGQPYKRKMVVMEERGFSNIIDNLNKGKAGSGVLISKIVEDNSDFKLVYDPGNPDADANGYMSLPNVDMVKEMMDMMSASRSYEANITAVNAVKLMSLKALDIGK
jgi:flagellar basal-body rod protein FlgC